MKSALVTGASAGIGEAFARALSSRGASVVLVARRGERLEALARELGNAEVLVADLLEERGIGTVAERLGHGDVDLLINNAGFGTVGPFHELPLGREMEQVDILVRAVVRLTHAALAVMVPRGSGGVINIASMAAFQPVPYNAVYAASKAFVVSFSEAVHEEVKPHGIAVTCACLGPVATEFQRVANIKKQRIAMRRLVRAMARTGMNEIVDTTLRAHERGEAVCVPGALNATLALSPRALPRAFVRRMAGRFYKRQ
jgi:short-subunit dehydrogenase